MKKVFISILAFVGISHISFSQSSVTEGIVPVSDETGLITYQEVITQTGTRQELYDRLMIWQKTFFPPGVDFKAKKNPAEGTLEMTPRTKLIKTDKKGNQFPAGAARFLLKVECKDGRYRYTITQFELETAGKFPLERWLKEPQYQTEEYKQYLIQINDYIQKLIANLEEKMSPAEIKKDEW